VGLIDPRTARQLLGLLVTAYIAGMDPSMLGVNSCSAAVDTTFIQAVAGGIAGGAVSCGADCAGMAGASAITFFAIGQWANGVYGSEAAGQQATSRAIAHGVGGCVISTFEGGKCGQGAATAFLGKAITSRLNTTGYLELDIARAGVVGGTLSSIGGGKFANGAMMGAFQYLFNELGSMKQRGYAPTYYNDDGIVCNASGSVACGDPHGSGSNERWSLITKESAKVTVRAIGLAGELDLDTLKPTFFGVQVGGPSIRVGNGWAYGWVSDQAAPMLKLSVPYGLLVGPEVGLSLGFNGIKISGGLAAGSVGQISGKFPQQTVVTGFGTPSAAIGYGKMR
jgi:hypothetical protein